MIYSECTKCGTPLDKPAYHDGMCADCSVEFLRSSRDQAYAERDRLVALVSKLYPSHLAMHPDVDSSWDPAWKTIVCVHTPPGQATWHIHITEVGQFSHLQMDSNHWDGHSADQKYERLASIGVENGK